MTPIDVTGLREEAAAQAAAEAPAPFVAPLAAEANRTAQAPTPRGDNGRRFEAGRRAEEAARASCRRLEGKEIACRETSCSNSVH